MKQPTLESALFELVAIIEDPEFDTGWPGDAARLETALANARSLLGGYATHLAMQHALEAWEAARIDGGVSGADLYEAAWTKTKDALVMVRK